MVTPTPVLGDRIHVAVGQRHVEARAVDLQGQRAAITLRHAPRIEETIDLTLRWSDGQVTVLHGRVAAVDDRGITHLNVVGVERDWGPWLAYLGTRSN